MSATVHIIVTKETRKLLDENGKKRDTYDGIINNLLEDKKKLTELTQTMEIEQNVS